MSSKYDVVKLKVHLSEVHYYVLSRFLLSKMLMFCRIPEDAAVRISLEVKKHFVNNEQTSITQEALEAYLHSCILAFGFAEEHTRLFPVVTQFNKERIPLVILLAGPACRGKTTLAHLLSARLNCSTIINTEVLQDITAAIDDLLAQTHATRAGNEGRSGLGDNATSSEVVAAVNAEIEKAVREGKVVTIEGEQLRLSAFHRFLDPAFQKLTGAVVVGVLVDALDKSATVVCAEYGEEVVGELQAVYTTPNVSVMCPAPLQGGGNAGATPVEPTFYVARCRCPDDNLELSAFLHDVVVRRIIGELKVRGKMPGEAEALSITYSDGEEECNKGVG